MPSRSALPPMRTLRQPAPSWVSLAPTLMRSALAKMAADLDPSPRPERMLSEADQALYDACRWDVERFAREFFPHLCPIPFSTMHEDFFDRYATDAGARGLRDATAAPRSFAKTTVIGKIKTIHDCAYQHERYIVILSSRDDLAIDKVKDIRTELESNTRLIAVYEPQVGPTWNMGDFITAKGVRVRAAARGSQVRGLLWGNVRPSKIILDDSENSELVLTEGQRLKTWDWFAEDISKLGDEQTNIDAIGTLLHEDSLLAKLLRNPGYRSRRYQAVLSFADASAVPLWQQWREVFLDLDNPTHQEDARAFFEAHEEAMLQGSAVLWPERYDYYRLMVERLVDGDAAFFKERQNQPQRAGDTLFAMEQAGYFTLTTDRLVRRDGRVVLFIQLIDVVAFWDPSIGQGDNPDWSACVVLGKDASGYLYVLDAYMSQGASPTAQVNGVADLLWRWRVRRFGYEANQFQSLQGGNVKTALAQRVLEEGEHYVPIYVPITNTRNKMLRISTLEPLITNQHLLFNEALPREYLRQMTVFRPVDGADKDDGPDATEGGVRVMQHVAERRIPR
mgnify:CR=1 FL=1